MKEAAEFLDELKIPFELTVVSAHRTPKRMMDYASSAQGRGFKSNYRGSGRGGAFAWNGSITHVPAP